VGWAAASTGIDRVALAGGCFFNRVLRRELTGHLDRLGLAVLTPGPIGPGDPAISLGQAYAAALAVE
jgi:hydrogenase maturation protein HypF